MPTIANNNAEPDVTQCRIDEILQDIIRNDRAHYLRARANYLRSVARLLDGEAAQLLIAEADNLTIEAGRYIVDADPG